MISPVSQLKLEIRREVRTRLKGLDPAVLPGAWPRLIAAVTELPDWQAASLVLLFVPLPDEPQLEPLLGIALRAGKRVALPAYDPATGVYLAREVRNPESDLVSGQFGIREPTATLPVVSVGRLDFAVVPGIAFTSEGNRLGRGKGFYDRLLASFRGVSCGVGLDEQMVPDLPVEPHDVKLSYVATPTRVWDCRGRAAC